MQFNKRILYIFILITIILFGTSCSKQPAAQNKADKTAFKILCTTFSQYNWVKNIIADIDGIEVEYILESGADLHNYQPSAEDIVNINECDLLIYVGGSSDYTILEIVNKANKSDSSIFDMMSHLNGRLLCDEDEDAEHSHNHNDENKHDNSEYDEHVWLSLKNAKILCSSIAERLCELLPEHSDKIRSNAQKYILEIENLDAEYAQKISECNKSQIVVADRFPLIYLAKDYSLECFKPFSGCSSETEASFDKILELSSKIDEYDLKYVIVLENSNSNIAKSVINNTKSKNQEILYINSLQSVTKSDIDNGLTFLDTMKNNLDVIVKVLND